MRPAAASLPVQHAPVVHKLREKIMLSLKKRAVFAVLAATLAGGAGAQSCVMAGGAPLRTSDGECVRTGDGKAPATPPAPKALAYSAEVLFAFDEDILTADARRQLDELAQRLVAMEVEKVLAVGYADDVGPAPYNRQLSARRAKAVGDYLSGKGVAAERLQLVAMGSRESITSGACDVMVPLTGGSHAGLVACLQPDRRVKVEMLGREKSAAD
jgi:outer membrane protein OmpA-like peptidoglycan-associated protein